MSLDEKVGQLLMVHFNGETVNDDAKTLIQKVHVGGFIYYNWANGLNSPEQVSTLSRELQKLRSLWTSPFRASYKSFERQHHFSNSLTFKKLARFPK